MAWAIRLVRSLYLLRGFSHEADEPPLGPIINPRYSAEGTTANLAHSGTIDLMDFETRLVHSGVGSIPRGTRLHFLILKSSPETDLKRSKFFLRVLRSYDDWIIVAMSSANARLVELGRDFWRSRRNGSTVRTKSDPERGQPWMIPDIIW